MLKFYAILLFLLHYQLLYAQTIIVSKLDTLKAGNATIYFKLSCATKQAGIQYIHVHENEQTAVNAANTMLQQYGRGCFVSWQSQGDRYVNFSLNNIQYKFDPNRIYTSKGRSETLIANGPYSREADSVVSSIANTFLKNYVDSQRLIVALHNNTDKGGLTITSFQKGGAYANDAKHVFVNKKRDADDFMLTTDSSVYAYIQSKGFNVLLQDNVSVTDDGSLSVYAAGKGIAYLNIEAEHGHLKQQLEMMDMVQEMIKELFPAKK